MRNVVQLILLVLVTSPISTLAADRKPLRTQYAADRGAVIAALSRVVADNAWHFDHRDDEHGDFRIAIPKTPMWQGKLVVYVASLAADRQEVTAYWERSGAVASKKVAEKVFTGIQQVLDAHSADKP